jgi:pyruvate dehydrogenase E2 component (dihydrolipoamide acetyltransferase)
MRRAMAARMAAAGAAVVPASVTEEADVDAWPATAPVTARLVAALAAGCRAEPALNAAFDAATLTRRGNAAVHVGIAVDTDDGLIVPVLRDAERLGPGAIDAALRALVAAARARRLDPQALRGATISLSNFGPLGGLFAALVVVPPQVAILGAGRIVARAVPTPGGIVARKMLPLSLSFDHRAVTGGEAARFLAAVKAALEAGEDRS